MIRRSVMSMWLERFNPNHGEGGKFTEGSESSSASTKVPNVKDIRAHLTAHGFNADSYRVSKDGKTITYKPRIVSYIAHQSQQNRLIESLKSAGYDAKSVGLIGTTRIDS